MNRRNFLSRAGLLLGGGIVAGPEVLDAFQKLTWRRKFFPGATLSPYGVSSAGEAGLWPGVPRDRQAILNHLYFFGKQRAASPSR